MGALLNTLGEKVLILEQHYVAGGLTHTFARKGFRFDVGLHYIGEVLNENGPIAKCFNFLSQGKIKWMSQGKVCDRVVIDKKNYALGGRGYDCLLEELSESFPGEREGLRKLFKLKKRIYESGKLYYLGKCFSYNFHFLSKNFFGRTYRRYSSQTTESVLNHFIKSTEVKMILTGLYGDYGLEPSRSSFSAHAMVFAHYIEGGAYPQGGAEVIGRSIVDNLDNSGVDVFIKSKVEGLIFDSSMKKVKGVHLESGRDILAKKVVSSIGYSATLAKLLPTSHFENSYWDEIKALENSSGAFVVYLGFDSDVKPEELKAENLWIFPELKKDASWSIEDKANIPYLFVSSNAPRDSMQTNKLTASLLCTIDKRTFGQWRETSWKKRGEAYEELKEVITQECLTIFFKEFPHLRGRVSFTDSSTPLSHQHFSANTEGEIYGLAASPDRFLCEKLRPHTPLENFYMTGVDNTMGGVVPAMVSGIQTFISMKGLKALFKLRKLGIF